MEELGPELGPLEDQEEPSEFQGLISDISHIITCLNNFSTAIQNPAPKDCLHKPSLTDILYFESLDIKHVEEKLCPLDPQDRFKVAKYLSDRLGKANTKRRHLLKLYRSHSKEIPPDNNDSLSSNELNYVSKSATLTMEGGSVRDPEKTLGPQIAATGYTRMKSQTTIPTINTELSQEDKIVQEEDRLSQSSYASTDDAMRIRVPSPPTDRAFRGEPFKCSYCLKIIKVRSRQDWKYVCDYFCSGYVC